MLVHLSGSLKYIESLKIIREVIHDKGNVLAHNWIDPAIIRKKQNIHLPDWTPYVKNNLHAITQAELVIVEISHYSFGQGFQVAAALEHKKPVLVLCNRSLQNKYISGFTNPLLVYQSYSSEDELINIVTSFLKKNTVHTKDLRFNFFMTHKIYKYLTEQSQITGKSKSEIIRDIIKHHSKLRDK